MEFLHKQKITLDQQRPQLGFRSDRHMNREIAQLVRSADADGEARIGQGRFERHDTGHVTIDQIEQGPTAVGAGARFETGLQLVALAARARTA